MARLLDACYSVIRWSDSKLQVSATWFAQWKAHSSKRKSKSEYFHGSRFQEHPIFNEDAASARSVLFLLSLDWVPLHKIGNYSLGVVSVSAANHSKVRRARGGVWPIALLEGPREPKAVFSLLQPLFLELQTLFETGIDVSDPLTSSTIQVCTDWRVL